ncbi:MAG: tryptophan synthase subunit alpha [candidate division WOR-3 bacterium]
MLRDVFRRLKKEGKKAFIPYITAGDPNLEKTYEIMKRFSDWGADLIELGVPFSDPMADGPTIQRAMERALKGGTNLSQIFQLVSEFRKHRQTPIILMGYMNPFFSYGFHKLVGEAKESGVDGILCVDLPPEEAKEFYISAREKGVELIFLISPLTDRQRLMKIRKYASGFLYFVSVTGVTGERENIPTDVKEMLEVARAVTRMPVVLGFGISGDGTIKDFFEYADGFVVGSALIRRLEEVSFDVYSEGFRSFFSQLEKACHKTN